MLFRQLIVSSNSIIKKY